MFCCISKKTTHRALLVLAACLVGIAAKAFVFPNPQAIQTASHEWGLSFQKEGQAPVPNLTKEQLQPYDAYYCGNENEKVLYITFDAGYENGNTAPILDALAKHNVQGTFFLVGPYIKENPELVKRMVEEGHIVGNHTYHHPNMTTKNKDEFQKELKQMEDTFTQITGKSMNKVYRPPEGKFTDENLQWAQEMGYKTIFWSLAYVDWDTKNQPSHEKAFSKLIPRTHNGAIVLLHSTSATNAQILDELLTKWEEMGYTFGSIPQLGQEVFCPS